MNRAHPSVFRSAAAAVVAAALASGALVGLAGPAAATSACATGGSSKTWMDTTGDHAWTNPANWEPAAVPDSNDTATVGGSATIEGVSGSVCDYVLTGAADIGTAPRLTGALTVFGEARLSGFAGAASGTAFTLRILGTVSLTDHATFDRISLELAAGTPGGKVDLKAKKLFLTGASTSTMEAGSSVVDTIGGTGAGLYVGSDAHIVVTTGATVMTPAIVRLVTGSTISTGGVPATLAGSGALNWQAGTLLGDLTLALQTVMDSEGTRQVPEGSTLTNTNNETGRGLQIWAGKLELGGPLVNRGLLRGFPGNPGPMITRTTTATGILDNTATGTLAVGASDTVAGSGQLRVDRLPLVNRTGGKVTVISGAKLLLVGEAGSPTQSTFEPTTTVSDPFTGSVSGSTPAKGTVQVASGSSLLLKGATTLQRGAILQLDDATEGTRARLIGDPGTAPKVTGVALTDGTFQWRSGTVTGPITIEKIATDVGAIGSTTRRYLEPNDPADAAAITFQGPVAVNATMVTLKPNARVAVSGALVIASVGSGFERSNPALLEGQKLTINAGGSLRRIAQATTPGGSSTSSGTTTVNVPVVNYGTVTLETSLNVPAGYTQDVQAGAPTTAPEPITGLLNTNAVTLSTGDGAGHFPPIELKKGGLGGAGTIATEQLTIGSAWVHPGFGDRAGKLTVQGVVKLSSGSDVQLVMRPAVPAVPETPTSPAVPAKPITYDVLEVVPLVYTPTGGTATPVAPGRIDLAGKITGVSAAGFNPAYGTTMPNLVTFDARTGSFANASWRGTPSGLGWKPVYDDTASTTAPVDAKSVELKLVDVAAPALGLASIPAFTQFTSQRISYAAVDNRTGVATYDVRWRRGGPNTPYSSWYYPNSWQNTTSTAKTLTGMVAGYTYCFSVRVRDKAGNISAWSQPLCTARMFDDRSFKATPSWYRPGGKAGFYGKTYSRSSSYGAKLTKSGQHTRVAVTALKCPTCGTINIYSGSTLLKTLSLKSGSTGITTWISTVLPTRDATLTVKVLTRGKPVVIDSFGMVR